MWNLEFYTERGNLLLSFRVASLRVVAAIVAAFRNLETVHSWTVTR